MGSSEEISALTKLAKAPTTSDFEKQLQVISEMADY